MRDKQGIPLLQMFAQCALHGATLEAAQSCIIWDAAIHQASRSVDLEVSLSLRPPPPPRAGRHPPFCVGARPPGRGQPAVLLVGLRRASSQAAPAPAGGAAHSGTCSGAGSCPRPSVSGTCRGCRSKG